MNVKVDLIPIGRPNRPGTPCTCEYITIHETDNESRGAGAAAHAAYIKSGAVGTTSWHYTVDDKEVVQHIPDEEIANHTGDLLGNKTSIGIEICVNADGDYSKAVANAVTLTRELMQRHRTPVGKVVQHAHWIKKDCPRRLRKAGWADFIAEVAMDEQTRFEAMYKTMIAKQHGDNPSNYEAAQKATAKAKAAGIFGGDGEGNFEWHEPVTREEMAIILDRIGALDAKEV